MKGPLIAMSIAAAFCAPLVASAAVILEQPDFSQFEQVVGDVPQFFSGASQRTPSLESLFTATGTVRRATVRFDMLDWPTADHQMQAYLYECPLAPDPNLSQCRRVVAKDTALGWEESGVIHPANWDPEGGEFSIDFTHATSFGFQGPDYEDGVPLYPNRGYRLEIVFQPNSYTSKIFGAYSTTTGGFNPFFRLEGDVPTSTPATTTPECTVDCNSSVIFIPGVEASRLYATSTDVLGLVHENRLWEPNTNADVTKLALSPSTGQSINPDIYTNDVLDEITVPVLGKNIYKTFLSDMQSLVGHQIQDFKILPYDWRNDVRDVVSNPIKTKTGYFSMVNQVEESAHDSRTGKVTIIAHSMGGLVAKALLDELDAKGEANLVDKVIFVATPQLGAPKGVESLLHGQSFGPQGYIDEARVREVAEDMKSGYQLLPSSGYFAAIGGGADPIIEFSTTTSVTASYRQAYGNDISTYSALRSFMLGEADNRAEPQATDVDTPNKLKSTFLNDAESWHDNHDLTWQPPSNVEIINIVGWGVPTERGIRYEEKNGKIDPRPLGLADNQMIEGDGTVVYLSAYSSIGTTYWVNLRDYNNASLGVNRNIKHDDILETSPLRAMLVDISSGGPIHTSQYISNSKPLANVANQLNVGVHSPVSLSLYDKQGRHTGPTPNMSQTSDLRLFEENIPNSYYWQLGEGQYAGAPNDILDKVVLTGTGVGAFDIDLHTVSANSSTSTVFSDVPVTPSTTAVFLNTGSSSIALSVDINGDGQTDATISSGQGISTDELLSLLHGLADTLNLPAKKDKKLDKKIAQLQKILDKEFKTEKRQKQRLSVLISNLRSKVSQWQKKGLLTVDEANTLISILDQINATSVR